MLTKTFAARSRRGLAALTLLVVAGCGGGDFAELFVKLITARFVPDHASVAAGASANVVLEVTCDREGLNTPFGRLGVRVKLDPNHTLAGGVTATLGGVADAQGFYLFPCSTPTASPDLRIANLPVAISVAAGTPALSTTPTAYIEVEPLIAGDPSKDSTTADIALTVSVAAAPVPGPGLGGNLLINGVFNESVGVGDLPTAPGNWRGDSSSVVAAEQDIAPRGAPTMLRFQTAGTLPGSSPVASRQWQIVDLTPFQAAVASGTVRARLAAFFNRIGGEGVDSRFDVRVLAYDGAMVDLPTRYATSAHLAVQATTLQSVAHQWQEAAATLVLPAATTYLLVEILAFDVVSEFAQFTGNYADDASLTLAATPPSGASP